jgi:hypothetical protein
MRAFAVWAAYFHEIQGRNATFRGYCDYAQTSRDSPANLNPLRLPELARFRNGNLPEPLLWRTDRTLPRTSSGGLVSSEKKSNVLQSSGSLRHAAYSEAKARELPSRSFRAFQPATKRSICPSSTVRKKFGRLVATPLTIGSESSAGWSSTPSEKMNSTLVSDRLRATVQTRSSPPPLFTRKSAVSGKTPTYGAQRLGGRRRCRSDETP